MNTAPALPRSGGVSRLGRMGRQGASTALATTGPPGRRYGSDLAI